MMERYDQCDDTCTTDCGHCKGAGRPRRMIRALTVRQPWAAAIVYLGKDVENRTRNIAGGYRGPVAIHAAGPKRSDLDYINAAIRSPYFDTTVLREKYAGAPQDLWWGTIGNPLGVPLTPGAFVGVVDLVDVHIPGMTTTRYDGRGRTTIEMACDCGPWSIPDHHHLVLANPRPLPRPIPAKGRLGLWIPGGALQDAIWEQVSA